MNAYEYGLENFSLKYQPKPNIVVFNDNTVLIDDYVTEDYEDYEYDQRIFPKEINDNFYLYAEAYHLGDNNYALYYPIRLETTDYVEQYLIPNNYFTDLGEDNNVANAVGNYQVYGHNNTFYVKYENPSYENTAFLSLAKPQILSPKMFLGTDSKLKEFIGNTALKLTFFFSEEGNKLINAYNAIDQFRPNEIVFFVEKDDNSRRVYVRSGEKITSTSQVPFQAIAELANVFKVDGNVAAIKSKIEEIFDSHLELKKEAKDEGTFYWVKKILKSPVTINNYVLYGLGSGLEFIGDSISNELTFDDKRWKYYDEDGNKSKKFSPVIPGFEELLDHLDTKEKDNAFTKQDTFEAVISALESKVNKFFDSPSNKTGLKPFFQENFGFLKIIVSKLKELYTVFKDTFTKKNTFIFGNALLVGIVNSLIKAIGGIISLIGAILQYPHKQHENDEQLRKQAKASTTLDTFIELLEGLTKTFKKLFSPTNIGLLFAGFVKMSQLAFSTFSDPEEVQSLVEAFIVNVASKTVDAAKYVSTRIDSVGYGLGFTIGFVIEEILTTIATGGAKTVATAAKVTVDSYKQLFSLGKSGVKALAKAPISFIDGLFSFFKYLRKLNVKKLIDDLIALFVKLFKTVKQLAEEAFKKLYPKGTKNRRYLDKAGYKATNVDDRFVYLCIT